MKTNTRRIVVLGAGFAGLRVVLELYKRRSRLGLHEIVLVDRKDTQTYTPLLPKIAAGVINSDDAEELIEKVFVPITKHSVFKKNKNTRYIKDEITSIDVKKSEVFLSSRKKIEFDDLVVAVGVASCSHGVVGVKKNAYNLKTIDDAIKINKKIATLSQNGIKVSIVGAGVTGTEFAAELASYFNEDVAVSLIQRGEEILPNCHVEVSEIARKRIEYLGVDIKTGVDVLRVEKRGVSVFVNNKKEFIDSDLILWTAGTEPLEIVKKSFLDKDERGFLKVEPSLVSKSHSNVFALGDCIKINNRETGEKVPHLAQVATEQAVIVAENIVLKTEGKKLIDWKPDNYWKTVIALGERFDIADLGWIRLSGRFAYLLNALVHFQYLLKVLSFSQSLKMMILSVRLFLRTK